MKTYFKISFVSALILTLLSTRAFASTTLEDTYFGTYKSYTCGYIDEAWVPGVKTGSSFETYKQIAARHRNTAQQNRNNRRVRAYYIKLAQYADQKYKASYKGCKKLSAPSSARSTTLSKLPSLETIVKANTNISSIRAVSGIAPTVLSINSLGAKNVFWNSGVVDAVRTGAASPTQCGEFFGSNTDGGSAGYGGCFMAQTVTETIGEAINSGTTMCYMKNAPTSANQAAGGIRVIAGSLPSGDISSLFATPSGSRNRVVGIKATGLSEGASVKADQYFAFIKIYSSNSNATTGNRYRFDFWSCDGTSVDEVQETNITTSGLYSSHNYHSSSEGNGDLLITAGVTIGSDGSITFDPAQDRTLLGTFTHSAGSRKIDTTIGGDNTILTKFYENFSTDIRYGVSKANFTGTSLSTLRFLSGAFKDRFFRGSTLEHSSNTGMEYRDTNYKTAPSVPELSELSGVSLDGDSFYSTPSAPSIPSGYTCSITPDVGVEMDFTTPAMQAVNTTCEGERRDHLDFCWSDTDLGAAQSAYHTSCP